MATFSYKATDKTGKIVEGSISAADRRAALRNLSVAGMNVVKLVQAAEASVRAQTGAESDVEIKGGEKTALAFFKKLLQLCKSGTPVGDALRGLSQRSLNKNMTALSKQMYKSLSEGRSLAQAMESYPQIFEKSLCHLVEAGESTANLVPVFQNIIDYLENRRTLRKQVVAALVYPVILFSVAFAVVMLFLFVLLPQIETMMKSLGGQMSLPVKVLMAFGDFMLAGGPVILALTALAALVIFKIRRSPKGTLATDRLFLKIPLIGKIALDADICRFTNLISTLFDSGVNTTETFRLAEKSVKNSDIRARFALCRTAVNDGAPVSASFKKFGLLADDDVDIISVGDRTGDMVECFKEVKDSHMEMLGARVKFAISALSAAALLSAFALVFMVALGIVSAVLGLSQSLIK